jgi:hypothetical protein
MTTATAEPDPRRLRIGRRLRLLLGPGPAAHYHDACALVDDPRELHSTTHIVSHLLREIESALRDVLTPFTQLAASEADESPYDPNEIGRPSIGEALSQLHRDVVRTCRVVLGLPIDAPTRPDVPKGQPEGQGQRSNIRAILSALNISPQDPVARKWLDLAGQFHGRAHRRALAEPRPVDDAFRQFFEDCEAILDYVLDRVDANYVNVFDVLDRLAAKSPVTKDDVKFLLGSVPQNAIALGRFYEAVSDPSWLHLLRRAGVFAAPPPPQLHEADNTVSFTAWPPMKYLIRLAPDYPEEVIATVNEIPSTENVYVNAAIVDVAQALPLAVIREVLPRMMAALDSPYKMAYPARMGRLIGRLASGGEISTAVELATGMLSFERSTEDESEPETEMIRAMREPRLRIDEHTYGEILERQVPQLVSVAGTPAIALLADLLEEAVKVSSSIGMIEAHEDFSTVWRREVAPEGLSHDLGVKSQLTSTLRDGVVAQVASEPCELQGIVAQLEGRQWSIFRRLAMHLLALCGSQDMAAVESRLMDRESFDDEQLRPEYDRLLGAHFGVLSEGVQSAILEWIDEGRDLEYYASRVVANFDREPTEEEKRIYVEVWQLERLAPIADQLSDNWCARYEQLVGAYGPPRGAGGLVHSGAIGPRSPTTAEELAALDIEQLLQYLREFEPDGDFFGPSKNGLAVTLTEVVAANPGRYMSAAGEFGTLDVEYTHGFLSGVIRVLPSGVEINWSDVLDLCEAIVGHPRTTSDGDEIDNGWGWARQDVMRLLCMGFEAVHPLLEEHRERVFAAISAVATDPYPSPADEERFGPPNTSPDHLALNSVRPRAIDAAVQYAVWIYRRNPEDPFTEVIVLLEQHLDPDADPSVAVRSVFGSQFGNLVALNSTWAAGVAEKVFPAAVAQRPLWEAAWDAYLWRGIQNKPTWLTLRGQYALAVSRVEPGTDDRHQTSRDHALVQHLMNLYWAGELDLGEGLLGDLYAVADDDSRHLALETIGRSLAQDGPPLDEVVVDRLLALWDARVEVTRTHPTRELSAFGWWFCSSHIDVDRRIAGLRDALELSGSAEPAHMIIEQLGTLSAQLPHQAAELLAEMVEHEVEGWRLSLWDDGAATVIRAALASSNPATAQVAREVASRAAARGHPAWLDIA